MGFDFIRYKEKGFVRFIRSPQINFPDDHSLIGRSWDETFLSRTLKGFPFHWRMSIRQSPNSTTRNRGYSPLIILCYVLMQSMTLSNTHIALHCHHHILFEHPLKINPSKLSRMACLPAAPLTTTNTVIEKGWSTIKNHYLIRYCG